MKMSKFIDSLISISIAMILMLGVAVNASAVSISLHPASSGVTLVDAVVNDTTKSIDIYETWNGNGYGYLIFSDLVDLMNYTVTKHITNATDTAWTSFSIELLDRYIAGAGLEDSFFDPRPYPGWVPDNPDLVNCSETAPCYSTSNNHDGLSFAQASAIPRFSSVFTDLIVDEISDERDFLDFYNATVLANNGYVEISFGLRVNSLNGEQQPFLMSQRPNEFATAVPEPETLILMVAGIFMLGVMRVRARTTASARVRPHKH